MTVKSSYLFVVYQGPYLDFKKRTYQYVPDFDLNQFPILRSCYLIKILRFFLNTTQPYELIFHNASPRLRRYLAFL